MEASENVEPTLDPTPAEPAAEPDTSSEPSTSEDAPSVEAPAEAQSGNEPTSPDSEAPAAPEATSEDPTPSAVSEDAPAAPSPEVVIVDQMALTPPNLPIAAPPSSGPGSAGWVDNPLQTGSTGFATGGGDITSDSPVLPHHLNPIGGEGDGGGTQDAPGLAQSPQSDDTTPSVSQP